MRRGTATQLRATAVTIAQMTSTLALRMGRPIGDRPDWRRFGRQPTDGASGHFRKILKRFFVKSWSGVR